MSHLNQIWAGKLICMLGGTHDIRRVQQAKLILAADKKNHKQLKDLREKMDSQIFWNFVLALAGGLVNIRVLQRVFSQGYGKMVSAQYFMTDVAVLSLWAGGSMIYSLRQLDPELEALRKKWMMEHNLEYLKLMRSLSMNYDFSIKDQIEPYVPKDSRLSWKLTYEELLK